MYHLLKCLIVFVIPFLLTSCGNTDSSEYDSEQNIHRNSELASSHSQEVSASSDQRTDDPQEPRMFAVVIENEGLLFSYEPQNMLRVFSCIQGESYCIPAFRSEGGSEFIFQQAHLLALEDLFADRDIEVMELNSNVVEGSLSILVRQKQEEKRHMMVNRNLLLASGGTSAASVLAFLASRILYVLHPLNAHELKQLKDARPLRYYLDLYLMEIDIEFEWKPSLYLEKIRRNPKYLFMSSLFGAFAVGGLVALGYFVGRRVWRSHKIGQLNTSIDATRRREQDLKQQLVLAKLVTESTYQQEADKQSVIEKENLSHVDYSIRDFASSMIHYLQQSGVVSLTDVMSFCQSASQESDPQCLPIKSMP
ncbi:MAG: hypothetical protein OXC44_06455 [Proteobacteria bacterium]|nr:hypothetical protein [Pseudomonadota bacterium]